ncbi:SCO5918 family protein [Streptomyces lasiicapitis]|nr:SCO5918 family protein [Streptomyces aureoverticillatus]
MRCVIARFPFDLSKAEVLATMKDVVPEPVTGGEYVIIGRRNYPAKQVGAVITRQDRRDFTSGEVTRAMTRLGFTCRSGQETAAPEAALPPVQAASAMLGGPSAPLGGPSAPLGGPQAPLGGSAPLGGVDPLEG